MNRPAAPAVFAVMSSTAATPQSALLDRLASYVLSILRIVAGLLIFQHGLSRLFGSPLPTPPLFTLYWFAGAIQFGGGILITFGLLTRPAAFIISGEMAVVISFRHAPRGFFPIVPGDLAVAFCFVFFYLVFAWRRAVELRRAGAEEKIANL